MSTEALCPCQTCNPAPCGEVVPFWAALNYCSFCLTGNHKIDETKDKLRGIEEVISRLKKGPLVFEDTDASV